MPTRQARGRGVSIDALPVDMTDDYIVNMYLGTHDRYFADDDFDSQYDLLQSALAALPDVEAEAFALLHVMGLKVRDAVALSGVPRSTLHARGLRARTKLQQMVRRVAPETVDAFLRGDDDVALSSAPRPEAA